MNDIFNNNQQKTAKIPLCVNFFAAASNCLTIAFALLSYLLLSLLTFFHTTADISFTQVSIFLSHICQYCQFMLSLKLTSSDPLPYCQVLSLASVLLETLRSCTKVLLDDYHCIGWWRWILAIWFDNFSQILKCPQKVRADSVHFPGEEKFSIENGFFVTITQNSSYIGRTQMPDRCHHFYHVWWEKTLAFEYMAATWNSDHIRSI